MLIYLWMYLVSNDSAKKKIHVSVYMGKSDKSKYGKLITFFFFGKLITLVEPKCGSVVTPCSVFSVFLWA